MAAAATFRDFGPAKNTDKLDKDQELYMRWKQTQSPMDLQALVTRMDPVIQNIVSKLGAGPVSADVLLTRGRILAAQAIKTYDPNKGTTLATHITNNLGPLYRVVYTYSNTARVPENITLKINQYNNMKEHLLSNLGREPTADEMHQELGWSLKEMKKLELYQRKDLVESLNNTGDAFGKEDLDDDLISLIYFDLTPQEKKLFEYTVGYGTPKRSNPEICKLLNISPTQLSYQKQLLTKKIKDLVDKSRYSSRAVNSLSHRDLG